MFTDLLAGVEASFAQIDRVFELNGVSDASPPYRAAVMRTGDNGVFLEVSACNALPFNVDMCAEVVWQYYRGNDKHRGPLYFKSAKVKCVRFCYKCFHQLMPHLTNRFKITTCTRQLLKNLRFPWVLEICEPISGHGRCCAGTPVKVVELLSYGCRALSLLSLLITHSQRLDLEKTGLSSVVRHRVQVLLLIRCLTAAIESSHSRPAQQGEYSKTLTSAKSLIFTCDSIMLAYTNNYSRTH